jgi:D-alanyl-D-alanine carboxypeptidase/D-alanyl-D-alanine-endopeptidase (penicillin-binding protein 4)
MRLGDKPKTFYRSVLHPDLYAAAVIRMQLTALGIDVKGRIRSGAAPDSARPLHTFAGSPLADIVRLFMKYSNNGIAEALVKNLAIHSGSRIGTWKLGGLAMRDRLIGLGVPAEGFDLVDGSGLSYHDRVSPRALVTALRLARNQFQSSPEFMSSLPVAGRDGTLKKRAKNARDQVRAKTGLLNGITGLSGYAAMPTPGGSGEREVVVFSVLANGYRKSDKEAIKSLDAFVSKLVAVDERGK